MKPDSLPDALQEKGLVNWAWGRCDLSQDPRIPGENASL